MNYAQFFSPTVFAVATALLGVSLAGCGGSGAGLDQNGQPIATNAPDVGAANSDFAAIQETIFTPICANCHAGAGAPLGLQLDAANSYALLIGVASSQVPSLLRVQPGNPDASYLFQKISGLATVGDRMPQGGPPLPQSAIALVRQWISNGAQRVVTQNNAFAATHVETASGLQVLTTAPLADSSTTMPLRQLVIGFDRELDTSLVNTTTVWLEQVTASGRMQRAAQLAVPLGNPWSLVITPTAPLATGEYLLTLRGVDNAALAGLDARPLQSRAASGGRDFTLRFFVDGK